MYIAQTDYSALFNAKRARGAANQTTYGAQSVLSQKAGFTLKQRGIDLQGKQLTLQKDQMIAQRGLQTAQTIIQGTALLLDAGQKIYGMYEEAETQKAKADILEAQASIKQKQIDMVANGDFDEVIGEDGKKSVQLNPEFDEYVESQIGAISENYGLGSVDAYIETSLLQFGNAEKFSAMDGMARKQLATIDTLDGQIMTKAVEQSIASGNTDAIVAQLKSYEGRRTSDDIEVRANAAMLQFENGMIKSGIRDVLHEDGVIAATTHIDGLQLSDDKKDIYKSYAISSAEAEISTAAAKVKQVADQMESEGKTSYEVADVIRDEGSIHKAYREKFADQYEYAGDMDTMKELVHTNGRDAALNYVNSPDREYTKAEVDQARVNVDLAEKNELANIYTETGDMAQGAIDNGTPPQSLYAPIEDSAQSPAHKEAAVQAIEAKHSNYLNDSFNGRYGTEMLNEDALKIYRDEIEKDAAGAYTRFPEVRRTHLETLNRALSSFPGGTSSQADVNRLANKYANTLYAALLAEDTNVNEIVDILADPKSSAYETMMNSTVLRPFLDKMGDYAAKDGPLATPYKGILADFDDFLDSSNTVDDQMSNELSAGLSVQMLNYMNGTDNPTEEGLKAIRKDYLNQVSGKVFDTINASYNNTPGDMKTDAQTYDFQKALDEGNFQFTVDGAGDVSVPSVNQAAFTRHMEVQRTRLAGMLDTTEGRIFHSGYSGMGDSTDVNSGYTAGEGGKVQAQPVYVWNPADGPERTYTFRAGEKKGEYDLYEIIDGTLSPVTVLSNLSEREIPASVSSYQERGNRAAEDLSGGRPTEPVKEDDTDLEKAKKEAERLGIY